MHVFLINVNWKQQKVEIWSKFKQQANIMGRIGLIANIY